MYAYNLTSRHAIPCPNCMRAERQERKRERAEKNMRRKEEKERAKEEKQRLKEEKKCIRNKKRAEENERFWRGGLGMGRGGECRFWLQ
jgi:hypothetical protein